MAESISDIEYAIRFCELKEKELTRQKYYAENLSKTITNPESALVIVKIQKELNEWIEKKRELKKLMEQKVRAI